MKRYKDITGDGGSDIVHQVLAQRERVNRRMAGVRHKVAVMSGKGGVGKSTITANLAVSLARAAERVGVLDADLNGPSIPKMMGVRGHLVEVEGDAAQPALGPLGIKVMSMDLFLWSEEAPVQWDGPAGESYTWLGTAEASALREFLSDIDWGELDWLLIDLPPGNHRLRDLFELLPDLTGVILVTAPTAVSQRIVNKSLTYAQDLGVPVLGVIENMSGYLCPRCRSEGPLFSPAEGRAAERLKERLLGRLPFDPRIARSGDDERPFALEQLEPAPLGTWNEIVERVRAAVMAQADTSADHV